MTKQNETAHRFQTLQGTPSSWIICRCIRRYVDYVNAITDVIFAQTKETVLVIMTMSQCPPSDAEIDRRLKRKMDDMIESMILPQPRRRELLPMNMNYS